jgi:uncharacterized protein
LIKTILDTLAEVKLKNTPLQRRQIAIFPLGSILYPGGILALRIFEDRYMQMAKTSLKSSTPFGIALIREGAEVGAPAIPESIGTLATIDDWDMPQLGILQVRVLGSTRYRIVSSTLNAAGLIVAQVEDIADDVTEASASLAACASFLAKVVASQGHDVHDERFRFDDAFWVSMRLTEMLPLGQGNTVKQKMLELTNATMRCEILQKFLRDQGLIAGS